MDPSSMSRASLALTNPLLVAARCTEAAEAAEATEEEEAAAAAAAEESGEGGAEGEELVEMEYPDPLVRLRVKPQMTVRELKRLIFEASHVPIDHQVLICNGRRLLDPSERLQEAGIGPASVLHLVVLVRKPLLTHPNPAGTATSAVCASTSTKEAASKLLLTAKPPPPTPGRATGRSTGHGRGRSSSPASSIIASTMAGSSHRSGITMPSVPVQSAISAVVPSEQLVAAMAQAAPPGAGRAPPQGPLTAAPRI